MQPEFTKKIEWFFYVLGKKRAERGKGPELFYSSRWTQTIAARDVLSSSAWEKHKEQWSSTVVLTHTDAHKHRSSCERYATAAKWRHRNPVRQIHSTRTLEMSYAFIGASLASSSQISAVVMVTHPSSVTHTNKHGGGRMCHNFRRDIQESSLAMSCRVSAVCVQMFRRQ